MAKDRLWFRCRHCGEQKLLAEYYAGRQGGPKSYCWLDSEFCDDDFIEKHITCSPNNGGSTLNGDSVFVIVAESAKEPATATEAMT